MKKFEVTISYNTIIEAEDYEDAKDIMLMDYILDKHDLDIQEVETTWGQYLVLFQCVLYYL